MDRMPGSGLARGTLFDKELNVSEIDVPTITVGTSIVLEKTDENKYTISWTQPSGADRTLSIPAMGADDTFVFLTATQTITNKAFTGVTDFDMTSGNKTILDTIGSNTLTIGAGGTTVVIAGNLTVSGTTTTIDTTTLNIADSLYVLNSDETGTPSQDSGFIVERGSSANVGLFWDESADEFVFVNTSEDGSTAGNVTIASYASLQVATLKAATSLLPDASGGADIGSASAEWGDLYIGDDKKIMLGDGQDVSLEYDEDGTDTLLITGGVTFADGSTDVDIASHDTSNGLKLGGTLVTSTAAELNKLDGTTATAASLTWTKDIYDTGVTATEFDLLDGASSIGTTAVSDGHGIVMNHGGTMAQTTVQTLAAYLDDEITAMPNVTTLAGLTAIGAVANALAMTFSDVTLFHDANNADTSFSIGTSATEALKIEVLNGGSNKTAEEVHFSTATASGTADHGKIVFDIDGTDILSIDDGGISIVASKAFEVAGTAILSDSSGTMTLSNVDALDATTEATIEAAIDTLSNLTAASALVTVSALDSGSITSGFGNIDNGSSTITTTGAITGGSVVADDVSLNGKTITMVGSTDDTAVLTVATNGAFSIVTSDTAAAAANIQITADGTVDIDSAGVLTLDSGAAINIEPASGSAILLDGTISIDAGVVTGATSITSTAFVGDITGDVTGTADVATVATTVTITDNESTDEDNAIIFTAGGDVDGGNIGLESDGTLTYNPSTGEVTATGFVGTLTGNVTGDASGTAATVTGGTQAAITTLANVTTVGALDAGSITSGFTSIDVGSGAITTTGAISGATIDATTDFTIGTTVITDDSIVMTPTSSDTVTIAAATNGALNITTVDDNAAAANVQITADGDFDVTATGQIELDANLSSVGTINFKKAGTQYGQWTSNAQNDVRLLPTGELDIHKAGGMFIRVMNTSSSVTTTIGADTGAGFIGTSTAHAFQIWSGNAASIWLPTGGYVRMGADSSLGSATLTVTKDSNPPLSVDRTTDDGTLIGLYQDGSLEGTIAVSGTTVSYNAFTGSHFATTEESIDTGMLVSMTGTNERLNDKDSSEILYGVVKSITDNDSKILGTYLGLMEPSKSASTGNPHLIASVGNGPMWLADKGANIAVGDYLIASDIAGHAMKDTGSNTVSYVIGRATEAIDWSTVSDTVGSTKHKLITVTYESFKNLEGRLAALEARVTALE